MSEKKIQWGFIGCGEVTKYKSGPAFQKIEGSEVVAVMSRNGEKAKAYAKERGIPKWYDDAQELIDDPEVNAVYIATPPSSHATYAIMSMKAGKPVYIEKPMAVTYEECCRINRISKETGVPCFVAYYRRSVPVSSLTTAWWAAVPGVLSPMNPPVKTVLRLSETKE